MKKLIIDLVNGTPGVDVTKIKCPICGSAMGIHRMGYKDRDPDTQFEIMPLEQSYHGCLYKKVSCYRYEIRLLCPKCHAELNITQIKDIYVCP